MDSLYTKYKISTIENICIAMERNVISEMSKICSVVEPLSLEMKALITVLAPYLFDAQHPDFDACPHRKEE